jgi:hypothetical protein
MFPSTGRNWNWAYDSNERDEPNGNGVREWRSGGVNCHGFYEYAAENRFQGASFGINLIKKF